MQPVLLMEIYKIHTGFDILNHAQQDVHDEVSWKHFFFSEIMIEKMIAGRFNVSFQMIFPVQLYHLFKF